MKISPTASECLSANLNIQTKPQLAEPSNSKETTVVSQPTSRLSIDQTINNLLKDLASSIDSRENLLNLLPSELQDAVVTILSQNLSGTENIQKGLASIVNAQKNAIDKLQNLAIAVKDAEFIKIEVPQEMSSLLLETVDKYLSPFFKTEPQLARWLATNSFSSIDKYITNNQGTAKEPIASTIAQQLPQQTAKEPIASTIDQQLPQQTAKEPIAGTIAQQLPQQTTKELITSTIAQELPQQTAKELITSTIAQQLPQQTAKEPIAGTIAQQLPQQTTKELIASTIAQQLPQQTKPAITYLVTAFSKAVPETLTQLAEKHKLPEVITLWSTIKLSNALPWVELESRQSHEARDTLSKLVASLQTTASISDETLQDSSTQKTFSMALPIYFENNPQPYPAYIHVYHEDKNNTGQYDDKTSETWLRVCLATENIGIVDAVFRLYQENFLSIRVAFSSVGVGEAFSEYLPEIESDFSRKALNLADICVK